MGTACFQGNILRRLNLTLMLKTNCYGVIQGETLPHRCSLATLCTHGKVPIIVAFFFMGMLFSAEVFVGKVALSCVRNMDTTIQKTSTFYNRSLQCRVLVL